MSRVMDVARLRTINCKVHINDRYIGSFIIYMYTSLVAAVLCVVVRWYCYGRLGWFADPPPPPHCHHSDGIWYSVRYSE
jgi:hypothetical protein